MQRCAWSWACLIGLSALACSLGCTSSEPGDSQVNAPAGESSKAKKTKAAKADPVSGPDVAVYDFLEAVRTGNDTKANDMLTKIAREKTAELDMVVAPPGSDTASFEVGDVEILKGEELGGAHVACTWTDVDEDGETHTDNIIWMLRLEDEGWRIAGMATKIFEDELPLFLNFEDPEDMMRKQQLAEQEMERRANAENAEEFGVDATNDDETEDAAASTRATFDGRSGSDEREATRPRTQGRASRQ